MASQKQIGANRKNALRSTGPRTDAGKKAIRYNAMTHGLLARDTIITWGSAREDTDEYEELLADLRESLQPEGRLELILMEKIATSLWRQCRAARAEVGAIRGRVDAIQQQLRDEWELEVRKQLAVLQGLPDPLHHHVATGGPTDREALARDLARWVIRGNPLGVQYLITTIDETLNEIAHTGTLSTSREMQLDREFGSGRHELSGRIRAILQPGREDDLGPPEEEGEEHEDAAPDLEYEDSREDSGAHELTDEEQTALVGLLHTERKDLEELLTVLQRRAEESLESAVASASIPADADVAKIQRYESMHERQFYRAIDELKDLQRHRMGGGTRPSLSVSVRQEE